MINLNITYVNDSENMTEYNDKEVFPTLKEAKKWIRDNIGKRPKSGMFIDLKNGESKKIGWVYSRYQNYYDKPFKRYIQGVWIEVTEETSVYFKELS
jgi:hypothetical protein